jgi:hypothetical protein
MSKVIQFGTSRPVLKVEMNEKLRRFEELKPRSFSNTLSDAETIEFDEIYEWLQIHKNLAI